MIKEKTELLGKQVKAEFVHEMTGQKISITGEYIGIHEISADKFSHVVLGNDDRHFFVEEDSIILLPENPKGSENAVVTLNQLEVNFIADVITCCIPPWQMYLFMDYTIKYLGPQLAVEFIDKFEIGKDEGLAISV